MQNEKFSRQISLPEIGLKGQEKIQNAHCLVVGAGGLGYELRNAMAWGPGRFDEAAAIFILLFGTIVFFDQVSSRYRNRLTEGQTQ